MANESDDGPRGARGARFSSDLANPAARINASIDFDHRLLPYDIAGSIAHASMLAAQGVISPADAEAIERGLRDVERGFASGEFIWDSALEDVHMNVEARLVESIGDAGRRLHTGRSRNDQVATDLRLYVRHHAHVLTRELRGLQRAILAQAERHIDTLLPGYTHLQRAQPIRLAHHLLAYIEMFDRDCQRLSDAARRANVSPLGSGALAGTTFPIDRDLTANALGFSGSTRNSLDGVSDRDFVVELVGAIALMQSHLSRLGEEIVLWVSHEFGFARIDDAYCSGSSLMPQKRNPDIAELLRAKVGRVVGDWVALMTVIKALPLAYNKDLQETQEPLYDAVETGELCLAAATGLITHVQFDSTAMRTALGRGYLLATDVAEYLVKKGIPFRRAHDVTAELVRLAATRHVELDQLAIGDFRSVCEAFDDDVFAWLHPDHAIDRRDNAGGPARQRVAHELAAWRRQLDASPD